MRAPFRKTYERCSEQRFHVLRLHGVAVLGAGIVERRSIHVDQSVGLAEQDLRPALVDVVFERAAVLRFAVAVGFATIAVVDRLFAVRGSPYSRRGFYSARAGLSVGNADDGLP